MVAVCTICGKECANGTGLSSHMKSHRHEQGIQARRHGLRQRVAPVTALSPHLCKACGMSFVTAKGLQVHAGSNLGRGCHGRRSQRSQPSSVPLQQMQVEEDIGAVIKMEMSDEHIGEAEILSEAASGDEHQGEGEGAYSGGNTEEEAEEDDDGEAVSTVAEDPEIAAAGSSSCPAPLPSNHGASAFVPDFNKALENSARFGLRREPCAFPRLRELQRSHPEVIELALLVDEVRISNKGTDASF